MESELSDNNCIESSVECREIVVSIGDVTRHTDSQNHNDHDDHRIGNEFMEPNNELQMMNEKLINTQLAHSHSNQLSTINGIDDFDNVFDDSHNHRQQLCSCSSDDAINYYDSINGGEWNDTTQMEHEHERLNASLMALTSHFAKVQLRLKQIVTVTSPDEREDLLKQLEQFAFRGIPEITEPIIDFTDDDGDVHVKGDAENDRSCIITDDKLEAQRLKQQQLIEKLKGQLQDLEQYAYETGDLSDIPSSMLLERQTVVIEQLKGKLPLNLDHFDQLSPEDLKRAVDKSIRDFVNPVIMKEQLVSQLKTQITDLERFIQFLQKGTADENSSECTCNCKLHGNTQRSVTGYDPIIAEERKRMSKERNDKRRKNQKDSETAIKMIRRALTILQLFTIAQFGCGNINDHFERNILKKTPKGNHWGDLRARLEMAIDHIIEIHEEKCSNDSDYTSDSDDAGSVHHTLINEKMSVAVRKGLASALRDLLKHGLNGNANITEMIGTAPSIFNWGCFSARSQSAMRTLHPWDVILKYYQLKNGYLYNASPARKLSQSFNLQIIGGVAITNKQTLLSCIEEIIDTHTKLKRSPDSHLKAFICAALNENKLVHWIKLIVKSRTIVDTCYEKWSYVSSTGFDDALRSLDRLSTIKFHLPCDLAIRQLQSINDAF